MTRTVLIVGASSGIGAALARAFARDGARVALVARREAELAEQKRLCDELAGTNAARAYVHDVQRPAEVPELFERIVRDFGGLDVVVYAAGYLPRIAKDEYDFAKDGPIIEVGLTGAVAWLNQAAAKFAKQRFGTICGISSIAGDRGRRAFPAYHAAKAGLDTYLEALRNRLHPYKVDVVTIKPGFVDTVMTQGMDGLFWLISPDQAATAIKKHIEKRRHTRYVPARWALVGLVIRNIPSFLFRRMDI
ncbi:MAG: SDR family NAD(P)-dependent oxidoreductase [Planctomycetes bacterium]|nr:SDR family NAD(P)-dependent oxidoreductase [Planctomycetota bacterium]